MSIVLIVLIVIISVITVFFEYMLIVNKVYPWDIAKASSWKSIWIPWTKWNWKKWPPWATDTKNKDGMCSLTNFVNIQDYSGNIVDKNNEIDCNNCINYLEQTSTGCTPLQYSSTNNACLAYGDLRICPG